MGPGTWAASSPTRPSLLPASEERRPPTLTHAIGGAGAQSHMARRFLPGLRPSLESGRLRLALVAGTRPEVAERFADALQDAGLRDHPAVSVLHERDFL